MRRAVPCVDGGVLGHQIRLAPGAHLLGQVGVLHIHEVPLVKAAHGLEGGSIHRRKAAGAELDLGGLCQVFVCHQVAVVALCPEAQTGQLTVGHGAHIAPAQRQLLFDPRRPILAKENDAPPAYLDPAGVCENSLIADGCDIQIIPEELFRTMIS